MTFPFLDSNALPAVLLEEAGQRWQRLTERAASEQIAAYENMLADAETARCFALVMAASQCSAEWCLRHPDWLLQLHDNGDLDRSFATDDYAQRLDAELAGVDSDEALARTLRRFRNRETLRIIWRDFNRLAPMEETTANLSDLAQTCIQRALDYHHRQLCEQWGTPVAGRDGQPQQLVVIAMGKFGAGELNLSSDIDLIFAYPRGGETVDGPKSVSNQEFFIRLGQRLIRAIDELTADGFVFRVDMRLRPYGDSGALVLSFDAMEEYYQDQGRDWERYALIKARAVAGDIAAGEALLEHLRPFVYRRYLDYSAIESLRSMKAMIVREVQRRNLKDNIKLGAGGIREIEFIAQCFQLIRGGREPELQERRLQVVLERLAEQGSLPQEVVKELQNAYRFLRDTEHAIQGYADKQSQQLPQNDYPRAALAAVMGCADWQAFSEQLAGHREAVGRHFDAVIAPPEEQEEAVAEDEGPWAALWAEPGEQSAAVYEQAGFDDAQEAQRRLQQLHDSTGVRRMQAVGRQRLDRFMPQLLAALSHVDHPTETLLRVLPLVEAVLRRTAYLVLLYENPAALRELVLLCSASPWIARQLAQHPVLLDELLDASSLYTVPPKDDLRAELQQQLLRLHWDDLEAHMDALRYFKLAHRLRVAASEVTERLPLMKVSDYLTWIAEVILEHVLELAWHNLVKRHGHPQRAEGEPCDKDFIVVGYGKLGGIELGHGSDLDLVFIHDAHPALATDGERSIDNSTFFTRLGQRMIHILSTQTAMGDLYEVDMRLRPSGESGLLVSSLKSFRDYQQDKAWTWEHQALVRARVVAGDADLASRFEQVRDEMLRRQRAEPKLRGEVIEMREKMRSHLGGKGGQGRFDLKQDPGGIVDIEFMVQFAVLAWSHQQPALTTWTDNIRILETLRDEDLLDKNDAETLIEAYKSYRAAGHRLALQHRKTVVDDSEFKCEREAVTHLWQRLLQP